MSNPRTMEFQLAAGAADEGERSEERVNSIMNCESGSLLG